MAPLAQLLDRLESDPHERGRQFERICQWYLVHDPEYSSLLERVWLWDEWPRRWGADAGIDLVAKTKSGELWAIQAKAYAPDYSVKKSDIDTFLSESARPNFTYRLLIATTNRIGATALRTVENQEKGVGLKLLADLEKTALTWPRFPTDLRAPKSKRKRPRPHQRKAITAVCLGFEKTERGQLIMACGTGKTLVGLWAAEKLQCQRTLVLVPSLSLLAQTMRDWAAQASEAFDILPVCSDETVRGADHLVSHVSELGLPVTTDPDDIAQFLRRRGRRVVFSTYQSSPRIAEAFALGAYRFDLLIADEAHRCAGSVSSDFATALDPQAIRSQRRLFMTATPRYFTDRVIRQAQEADFEIASMDDEATFGPVFHRLSFGEAIERDLLSDYQVVIVGVDDPTYRKWAERGTFVTRDGKEVTDARTLAAQIGLAKAMRKYDLRRTISFHGRVKRAREFSREFSEVVRWMPAQARPRGELHCDFVSGAMPSGQRDVRLDRLRHLEDDERALLSNARCLSEGVDVPNLDGVAFIDPRRSQVDIVQAVGRAIRKAVDKTVGTIVLPVFVDRDRESESALEASPFRPIWWVLKALRAHDEELGEELDAIRRETGRLGHGGTRMPSKIKFDLPAGVGREFAAAFRTKLVEQTTASWEFWFGLLEKFVEREGHSAVPVRHEEEGWPVGKWVDRQRVWYRSGRLSSQRVCALEGVPGWAWNAHESSFDEALRALRRFVKREGHSRCPRGHEEDSIALGAWVGAQRGKYRRGDLSLRHRESLEELPGWAWDAHQSDFENGFAALCRFVDREGDACVPASHLEGSVQLGKWVSKRRSEFRKGKLAQERAQSLEKLPGWVWDLREAAFEAGIAALEEFVGREGHARVPRGHREGSIALGKWVSHRRSAFKTGTLPSKQVARLEKVHGWTWDVRAAVFREGSEALGRFIKREGHARVPRSHKEGPFRLGQWVTVQRVFFRKGKLPPERVAILESLPGWTWEPHRSAFDKGLIQLSRFVEREGHASVPYNHEEGSFPLGRWASKKRSAFRKGRLNQGHIAALEAIPGWEW